jgi:hypothetical protein
VGRGVFACSREDTVGSCIPDEERASGGGGGLDEMVLRMVSVLYSSVSSWRCALVFKEEKARVCTGKRTWFEEATMPTTYP